MGSDVSHFTVSLIVLGNVAKQCPQITIFEERGEPKRGVEPASFRLPARSALPPGQAGSLLKLDMYMAVNGPRIQLF